jgi:regulator of RNase E activity RraA
MISTEDATAALWDARSLELYTPVVGDILDELGFRRQFLPPEIHGITRSTRVVGRAMPVLVADVTGPQRRPFGRLTEALDQLEPGEVYIAQNATIPCSAWGEIMTSAAMRRGAAGAVVDGYHRDTPRVLKQGFSVFSRGAYAQDARVRSSVIDLRCRIRIGDAEIAPGDIVFGDVDGVVVVPGSVADEVLELALAKARAENTVRGAIERGMSATDAFSTYGVL